MDIDCDYYRHVTVGLSLDRTVAKLTRALQAAGFVINGGADLESMVADRLDRRVGRAVALHVYDPKVTVIVLDESPELAAFLPFTVAVRETARDRTVVSVAAPLGMVTADAAWRHDHPGARALVARTEARLGDVLSSVVHGATVAA